MTHFQTPPSPGFAAAARAILAQEAGAQETGARVAEGAAKAWEKLAQHFSRVIGHDGVRTILVRSATLASASFPWLTQGEAAVPALPWTQLRLAVQEQAQDVVEDAFATLLATFVALLGRLIGEGLVTRLLHEVWPAVFHDVIKGPT